MKIKAAAVSVIIFAVVLFVVSFPVRAEVVVTVPQVQLPKDELPHEMPVEWWYYSGHLTDAQGHRYGVMASFFTARYGTFPRQHFMIYQLVDKDAKKFYSGSVIEKDMVKMVEQVAAALPPDIKKNLPPDLYDKEKIAKYHRFMKDKPIVKKDSLAIKYGDEIFQKVAGEDREWTTYEYKTTLVDDAFTLDLDMKPTRGPMFVGGNGNVGMYNDEDMFYYSFTRMDTKGVLKIGGVDKQVTGTIWYDHQFGSMGKGSQPLGWDWFCIQLEDGTDLNLSALRYPLTEERFNRLGTVQWADGRTAVIHDLVIEQLGKWTSKVTGTTYPMGWMIAIPSLGMSFTVKPEFPEQEMHTYGPMQTIWEGACTVEATVQDKKVKGDGYTELVGYGFPKD